jgi:hypothetical protein
VIWFGLLKSKNKQYKAILTVLNTTSRMAYARALKDNKSAGVSVELKKILDEIVSKGHTITALRVDGGSEFKGETQKMLVARGIKVERAEPFTHSRLRRTDAFHKFLRLKIGHHFEDNNTSTWYNVLPDIVHNINTTPNTGLIPALGTAVAPANLTTSDMDKIHAYERKQVQKAYNETSKLNIIEGLTRVRLLMSKTKEGIDKFSKAHKATWSAKTYRVLRQTGPNSFEIDVPPGEVKIWQPHSLKILSELESREADTVKVEQPVKKAPKRVNEKAERLKRMEALNISEVEQKSNVIAARTRGSKVATRSKKKVSYRSMVGLK